MSARKMKDSGNQWIGKIPEEWEIRKIKFVANISTGNTPSKNNEEYYAEEGLKWVKPDNLAGFNEIQTTEEYLSDEGQKVARIALANSVLVCCIGTIGKIGYSSESVAYNQQINAVSFGEKVNWKYGMYFLSSQQEQARFYMNGNVVFILNTENQKKIEIALPDLNAQQKIVSYLDEKCAAIDKIVASKQKQNEQLAEYRQSLITEAVTKGLEPLAPMQDSGIEWIGEIPEKWEIKKVKYLFSVVNGATPKSSVPEYWDGDIMWITPADMSFEMFEIKDSRQKITAAGLASCGTTLVPKGSIVISTRAPIGQICIAGKELCTNQGCKTLVCFEELCNEYFYYYLKVQANVLNMLGRGTTFLELSSRDLEDFLLLLPPLAEQKEIAAYLDKKCGDIDALREHNKNIIESLQEYKQSLIYEAVTGKIEL